MYTIYWNSCNKFNPIYLPDKARKIFHFLLKAHKSSSFYKSNNTCKLQNVSGWILKIIVAKIGHFIMPKFKFQLMHIQFYYTHTHNILRYEYRLKFRTNATISDK